jgi:hypothetical protein
MIKQEESPPPQEKEVFVVFGQNGAVRQPATFRCCPLGIQFYTQEEVAQYRVVDIKLAVPDSTNLPAEIDCSGVVVHCERMNSSEAYRVWVYFLDLPEPVRGHLQCMAKQSETLCPYCENF